MSKNYSSGDYQGAAAPLFFNPALTTAGESFRRNKRSHPVVWASERIKTVRFSFLAGFAARKHVCVLGKTRNLIKVPIGPL